VVGYTSPSVRTPWVVPCVVEKIDINRSRISAGENTFYLHNCYSLVATIDCHRPRTDSLTRCLLLAAGSVYKRLHNACSRISSNSITPTFTETSQRAKSWTKIMKVADKNNLDMSRCLRQSPTQSPRTLSRIRRGLCGKVGVMEFGL